MDSLSISFSFSFSFSWQLLLICASVALDGFVVKGDRPWMIMGMGGNR